MQKEKLQKGKQNPTSHIALHTSQKGITLIALIITIIVMLILVGVTVTVALNGGLFSSAKDATKQTQIESEKEQLLSAMMGAIGNDGKVKIEELSKKTIKGFTIVESESDNEKITYINDKTGNKYTVTKNRVITLVEDSGDVEQGGSGQNPGEGGEQVDENLMCKIYYRGSFAAMDVYYKGEGNVDETYTVESLSGSAGYSEEWLEMYNYPYYWFMPVQMGQKYDIKIIRDSDGEVVAQKEIQVETYDSIFECTFDEDTKTVTINSIKEEYIKLTKGTKYPVVTVVEEFSIIDSLGNEISTLEIPSTIKLGNEEYRVTRIESIISYSTNIDGSQCDWTGAKNTNIKTINKPSNIEISENTLKYFVGLETDTGV